MQKPVPRILLKAVKEKLAFEDKAELGLVMQAWRDRLQRFGLKLNVNKTEFITSDVNESVSSKVNGTGLNQTPQSRRPAASVMEKKMQHWTAVATMDRVWNDAFGRSLVSRR